MLRQWEFVFIRRRVEKGRYYLECNQQDEEETRSVARRGGRTKLSSKASTGGQGGEGVSGLGSAEQGSGS